MIDDTNNYTDVYLVGTSQTAEVLIQRIGVQKEENTNIELLKSDSVVVYEPCENYGIIHIYSRSQGYELVTVSVDGYQYQFIITRIPGMSMYQANADRIPVDYMIEECSVDEIVEQEKINVNYSTLEANSRTYFAGDEWIERIGTKFVEAVEDEAVSMAAGFLLKAIFM